VGDELLEEGAGNGLLKERLIWWAGLIEGKGPFSYCKGLGNIEPAMNWKTFRFKLEWDGWLGCLGV
jgi:hypothetical protein